MTPLDGKRVLVTGANGFIGSHLVERLLREGAEVRALCMYNENGSFGWLDELDPGANQQLDLRLGDIRDPVLVGSVAAGVHVIFHLAALVSIPYSYEAPAAYVDTNVSGTLNVLEAARRHGVSGMVHTSTSEVYGTPETVPITESHPLRGQSPYSASKIGADQLCEAYARSFDVPVVTLRPFNTYGPRQSRRAVIPTILSQLIAGTDTVRLGSLHPRRDFTFVEDTVDGFVRMASEEIQPGETVQLGTGSHVSVAELFDLCCDAVGQRAEIIVEEERVRPERSEVDTLLSDPSKARKLLGWSPQVDLLTGLERTVSWMREQGKLRDPARYER